MLSVCVLIRTSHGKFEDAVKRIKQLRNVKVVFPVLGRYDAVADIEVDEYDELASTILRVGRITGVVFTESLVQVK